MFIVSAFFTDVADVVVGCNVLQVKTKQQLVTTEAGTDCCTATGMLRVILASSGVHSFTAA